MKYRKCIINVKAEDIKSEEIISEKNKLIRFISNCSSKYGDKLIEFMEIYRLNALNTASVPQLREYISTHLHAREPELIR